MNSQRVKVTNGTQEELEEKGYVPAYHPNQTYSKKIALEIANFGVMIPILDKVKVVKVNKNPNKYQVFIIKEGLGEET